VRTGGNTNPLELIQQKLIYIVSDIDKALAFEWVGEYLQKDYDLQFILIGSQNSQLQEYLSQLPVKCHVVSDAAYPTMIAKWWRVVRILFQEKPDIVHTHLWRANLIGLSASWLMRVPRRIYTRHHATIHYREYPSGRKWDILCNALATHIVAISKSIEEILVGWDKANPDKVFLIHHGFDFNYFQSIPEDRIKALRDRLKIADLDSPIIGAISRYTKWKGVQHIIEAFAGVRKNHPGAVLILANASGDYSSEIKKMLASLPTGSYREVVFEKDLAALYQMFDVFVHVPTDQYAEAFGQTYVEALISAVPSVFTLSGVASEFIKHEQNALVVPFENSLALQENMERILTTPALKENLVDNGKNSVLNFTLQRFIQDLKDLYARS
jgi:glycosyltransferase involved in cell wall biosynthesis